VRALCVNSPSSPPGPCRYNLGVPLLRAIPLVLALSLAVCAQEPPKPSPPEKPAEPQTPAQIELLETKVRFEVNGDSRKEVHCIVKIHSELGARQFATLKFDYNRAFENVEIPFVRVTHSSGGTADILPSAISDNPNPAVINYPAYHDVRVKSVRILGLAPSDTLEYRVITTVTHHPLAPDFWLDHSFDPTGVVSHELFTLDLPANRNAQVRISPVTPATSTEKSGEGEGSRLLYRWTISGLKPSQPASPSSEDIQVEPDVVVSTEQWEMLSIRLDEKLTPGAKPVDSISDYEESMHELLRRSRISGEIATKAIQLTSVAKTNRQKLEAIYRFASEKIQTVDLPLGSTGFVARRPEEILSSGYASPEDKFVIFAALAAGVRLSATAGLTGYCDQRGLPRPTPFKRLIIAAFDGKQKTWIDPSLEVAPFGVIPGNSGTCAFVLNRLSYAMSSVGHEWEKLATEPPFPSTQHVSILASLDSDGTLKGKVRYSMRGQNELALRLAFHQSPREKWNEVAQLLSLSDGFRGKVTSVSASDPYATKDPFTVEYEISQPKFVDWSKKPVRIPAVLPLVGLPDPPADAKSPIELGTPLDVQTYVTLHLPPGTTVESPAGINVSRDYATFSSQYAAAGNTLTASRHIQFISRQVPASRAADYNAFVRAVQNDQSQLFRLTRPDETPPTEPRTSSNAKL